jgi:hypothetical protein
MATSLVIKINKNRSKFSCPDPVKWGVSIIYSDTVPFLIFPVAHALVLDVVAGNDVDF